MFLTANAIQRLGACGEYVDRFRTLFPNGTEVTPELCVDHQGAFDWHWAAAYLMSPEERVAWNRAVDDATRDLNQTAEALQGAIDAAAQAQRTADSAAHQRYGEEIRPLTRQRDAAIVAVRQAFDALIEPLNVRLRQAYEDNARAALEARRAYDEGVQPLREKLRATEARLAGEIMAARTAPPGMDPITPPGAEPATVGAARATDDDAPCGCGCEDD